MTRMVGLPALRRDYALPQRWEVGMCAETENFTLQPDKLVEAVIYLAERSADDPHFG